MREHKPEHGTGLRLCPGVSTSTVKVPSVTAVKSRWLPREGPGGSALMVQQAQGNLSTRSVAQICLQPRSTLAQASPRAGAL